MESTDGTTAESWDDEIDVIVVGHGAAGVSAAIEARQAGAEVLLLEASGGPGGASAMSGGLLYLGGATALQRACGFEDTVENMRAFLTAACGPGTDSAKIEAYCAGSVEHYDWLVGAGVPFKPSFWDRPTSEPWNDDGLMFSGGERAHPFSALATPAPRGHVPQTSGTSREGTGGGHVLMERLGAMAEALGVRCEYGVTITDLMCDGDRRVVGLVARRYGATLRLGARCGVVLAAGSFTFDPDLLGDHVPCALGTDPLGVDTHDGTVLRAALSIGAAATRLDTIEVALGVPPSILQRSIVVNGAGQRFLNEDAYMGRIGVHALRHHGGWAMVIFDETGFEAEPELRRDFLPTHTGATVEELAKELKLNASALADTLDAYNRHAVVGEDPTFHKASVHLAPITGPYGAVLAEGRFRTFTLGGLKTDVDGAVIDVRGKPMPGFFAAGRVTSGIAVEGYVSGISLGDSTFFGRRAGAAVARSAP